MSQGEENSSFDGAWSKTRRRGNDEIPFEKTAVKIIRSSRVEDQSSNNTTTRLNFGNSQKPVVTKVAKLIYEPIKKSPKITIKSIHTSYRTNKFDINSNPFQNKDNNKIPEVKIPQNSVTKNSFENLQTKKHEDFVRKKLERQKDVAEIQEILKTIQTERQNSSEFEIKNKLETENIIKVTEQLKTTNILKESDKLKTKTIIVKEPEPNLIIKSPKNLLQIPQNKMQSIPRRSKTETNLRNNITPKAGTSQQDIRSKSSSNLGTTRSSENIDLQQTKKKSYDPDAARQYMEEQKKKRKLSKPTSQSGQAVSGPTDIKKRLEDLRKNTLKILNRNLQKKIQNPLSTPTKNVESSRTLQLKKPSIEKKIVSKINVPKRILKPSTSFKTTPKISNKSEKEKVEKVTESFEKIGLLRKTDEEMISSENINDINKENQISIIPNIENNTEEVKIPKSNSIHEDHSEKSRTRSNQLQYKIDNDFELVAPDVKLKTTISLCEKSTQFEKPVEEKTPLPYWLKPTPVEFYPYNFIMAVRKKLEAIANPVRPTKTSYTKFEETAKMKHHQTTLLSYPKDKTDNNSRRRRLLNQQINNEQFTKENLNNGSHRINQQLVTESSNIDLRKTKDNSKSFSELASNFSSITVQVPGSNTVSEVSSIHSESVRYPLQSKKDHHRDDDTTISSSIFSSPEKKKSLSKNSEINSNLEISPLSIENIANMQIKSKTLNKTRNMDRGDFIDTPSIVFIKPHNIPTSKRLKSSSIHSKVAKESNMEQLLEDFNRSLSEVIVVNQKLQNTLKSPDFVVNSSSKSDVIKTESSQQNSGTQRNDFYSSDFEEIVSSFNQEKKSIDEEIHEVTTTSVSTNPKSRSTINSAVKNIATDSINKNTKTESEKSNTFSNDITTRHQKASTPQSSVQSIQSHTSLDTTKTIRNVSDEFFDSIEEISSKYKSLHEKLINSFSIKQQNIENPSLEDQILQPFGNYTVDQFSRDSLDLQNDTKIGFIDELNKTIINQVNTSRGDFSSRSQNKSKNTIQILGKPLGLGKVLNSTIGSEILTVFNQSDFEFSIVSQSGGSISEANLNYSTIGAYEQLLNTETSKSEYLVSLLRIREKSLLDRTRGQIAWLEVQKEKYKSKGLTLQISAIKKKQRAILLKMEKEREEIKRILKISKKTSDVPKQSLQPCFPQFLTDVSIRKNFTTASNTSKLNRIVKGYELDASHNLELILLKREEELRKRREHVERLVQWHQRLDQEEHEVLQIEEMLFKCNSEKTSPEKIKKKEKKILEIDKSLKDLQNISTTTDATLKDDDYVRTTGNKLNKLWRRLTGRTEIKYESTSKFKLYKEDLEKFYEEAKITVLKDFGTEDDLKTYLEQSKYDTSLKSTQSSKTSRNSCEIVVPSLNLNFSSAQSDPEIVFTSIHSSKNSILAIKPIENIVTSPDNDSNTDNANSSLKSDIKGIEISPEIDNTSSIEATKQPEIDNTASIEPTKEPETNTSSIEPKTSPEFDTSSKEPTKEPEINNTSSIEHKTSPEIDNTAYIEPKTSPEFDTSSKQLTKRSEIVNTASIEPKASPEFDYTSSIEPTKRSEIDSSSSIEPKTSPEFDSSCKEPTKEPEIYNTSSIEHKASPEIDNTASIEAKTIPEFDYTSSIELTKRSESDSTASIEHKTSSEIVNTSFFETKTNTGNNTPTSYSVDSFLQTKSSSKNKSLLTELVESLTLSGTKLSSFSKEFQRNKKTTNENNTSETIETDNHKLSSDTNRSSNIPSIPSDIEKEQNFNYSESFEASSSSNLQTPHELLTQDESNSIIKITIETDSNRTSTVYEEIDLNENSLKTITEKHSEILSKNLEIQKTNEITNVSISLEYDEKDNSEDRITSVNQVEEEMRSEQNSFENNSNSNQYDTFILSPEISENNTADSTKSETTSTLINKNLNLLDIHNLSVNGTLIDDISIPKFELTNNEDSKTSSENLAPEINDLEESIESTPSELEKRLIDLDESLKDLNQTFERALSPEKSFTPPISPSPTTPTDSRHEEEEDKENIPCNQFNSKTNNVRDYMASVENNFMPDIINEVEIRRRQQVLIESDTKQLEHAVPYVFLREIPNRPPPPYVSPAHGSPMTTIFPSERRIKDITFRRTKELFEELTNPENDSNTKSSSIMNENITNIYERMILDICKECIQEYGPIDDDKIENFKKPLALFNPPDRLKCIQEFVYKQIRKLLAMDKKKVTKKNSIFNIGRRKRDHVDEILLDELFEDETKWTNFDVEEAEVKSTMTEEILNNLLKEVLDDFNQTHSIKSEED